MNGFLSRLADRATNPQPNASPRVPSRFEIADSVASLRPAYSTFDEWAPSVPSSSPHQLPRSEKPSLAAALRPPTPAADAAQALAAAIPLVEPIGSAEGLRPREQVKASAAPAASDLHPVSPATRAVESRATTTVQAVPRAAAEPSIPAAPSPVSAGGADAVAPEHVVQISIGRVEVRAAIVAPPAPERPVKPDRSCAPAPALPLHDYLRGRREVR